jgi:hypothetical protein
MAGTFENTRAALLAMFLSYYHPHTYAPQIRFVAICSGEDSKCHPYLTYKGSRQCPAQQGELLSAAATGRRGERPVFSHALKLLLLAEPHGKPNGFALSEHAFRIRLRISDPGGCARTTGRRHSYFTLAGHRVAASRPKALGMVKRWSRVLPPFRVRPSPSCA